MRDGNTLSSTIGASALLALALLVTYTIPFWAPYKWPAPALCTAVALVELLVGVRAFMSRRGLAALQHWTGALAIGSFALYFDWIRLKLDITSAQGANVALGATALFAVISCVFYALKIETGEGERRGVRA